MELTHEGLPCQLMLPSLKLPLHTLPAELCIILQLERCIGHPKLSKTSNPLQHFLNLHEPVTCLDGVSRSLELWGTGTQEPLEHLTLHLLRLRCLGGGSSGLHQWWLSLNMLLLGLNNLLLMSCLSTGRSLRGHEPLKYSELLPLLSSHQLKLLELGILCWPK
ncbi:hypothetical protein Dimus_038042 [Dionaea muscipula]